MGRRELKPGVLTAPLPAVLVSVSDGERANLITIGWTGILSTHPPRTYISVRPERHSYGMLKRCGEFVINLTRADMARQVDYAGVFTGAKVDKFAACGLTPVQSKAVTPPTVAECPVALECRVVEVIPMGTHDVFIADIVSVSVDEEIIDGDGRLRFDRANLMAYAHGEYFALGESLGKFGFSARRGDVSRKGSRDGAASGKRAGSHGDGRSKSGREFKGTVGATESEVSPADPRDSGKKPFYLSAPRGKGKGRTQGTARRIRNEKRSNRKNKK